eukprot:7223878-Prymnesium_polylepis.1
MVEAAAVGEDSLALALLRVLARWIRVREPDAMRVLMSAVLWVLAHGVEGGMLCSAQRCDRAVEVRERVLVSVAGAERCRVRPRPREERQLGDYACTDRNVVPGNARDALA